jgi:hypothetical protein
MVAFHFTDLLVAKDVRSTGVADCREHFVRLTTHKTPDRLFGLHISKSSVPPSFDCLGMAHRQPLSCILAEPPQTGHTNATVRAVQPIHKPTLANAYMESSRAYSTACPRFCRGTRPSRRRRCAGSGRRTLRFCQGRRCLSNSLGESLPLLVAQMLSRIYFACNTLAPSTRYPQDQYHW